MDAYSQNFLESFVLSICFFLIFVINTWQLLGLFVFAKRCKDQLQKILPQFKLIAKILCAISSGFYMCARIARSWYWLVEDPQQSFFLDVAAVWLTGAEFICSFCLLSHMTLTVFRQLLLLSHSHVLPLRQMLQYSYFVTMLSFLFLLGCVLPDVICTAGVGNSTLRGYHYLVISVAAFLCFVLTFYLFVLFRRKFEPQCRPYCLFTSVSPSAATPSHAPLPSPSSPPTPSHSASPYEFPSVMIPLRASIQPWMCLLEICSFLFFLLTVIELYQGWIIINDPQPCYLSRPSLQNCSYTFTPAAPTALLGFIVVTWYCWIQDGFTLCCAAYYNQYTLARLAFSTSSCSLTELCICCFASSYSTESVSNLSASLGIPGALTSSPHPFSLPKLQQRHHQQNQQSVQALPSPSLGDAAAVLPTPTFAVLHPPPSPSIGFSSALTPLPFLNFCCPCYFGPVSPAASLAFPSPLAGTTPHHCLPSKGKAHTGSPTPVHVAPIVRCTRSFSFSHVPRCPNATFLDSGLISQLHRAHTHSRLQSPSFHPGKDATPHGSVPADHRACDFSLSSFSSAISVANQGSLPPPPTLSPVYDHSVTHSRDNSCFSVLHQDAPNPSISTTEPSPRAASLPSLPLAIPQLHLSAESPNSDETTPRSPPVLSHRSSSSLLRSSHSCPNLLNFAQAQAADMENQSANVAAASVGGSYRSSGSISVSFVVSVPEIPHSDSVITTARDER